MQLKMMFFVGFSALLLAVNSSAKDAVKPVDICKENSEIALGESTFEGILISDGEHFNLLKSKRCPKYSLGYTIDVPGVERNSPAFWNAFSPVNSFNLGLKAFCISADGNVVDGDIKRYFIIRSVKNFSEIKVNAQGGLDLMSLDCDYK